MTQGDELINTIKYSAYDFLSIPLNDTMGRAKQFTEIFRL
jgi:hypothetical protein